MLACAAVAALTLAACIKSTVQLGTDTGSSSTSGSGNGNGGGPGNGNGGGPGMTEQCGNGGSGFGGSGSQTFDYTDPPGLDTSKAVGDLTSTEVTAWCTWFLGAASILGPVPHDAVPQSSGESEGPWLTDGYVWGAAGIYTGNGGPCILRVSVHDCVENLTVTHCGATVKALDDCVQSFLHGCPSEPTWCDAYLAQCDETIVVKMTGDPLDDCHLPVQ